MYQAKLNTSLTRTFSVALFRDKVFGNESAGQKEKGGQTDLSLGSVAVETRLGCSVPSSLPMVCIEGELEIHNFALELQGGLKGGGGDHSDEARNGQKPGNGLGLRASGAIK
jgi:hypothetical protein